MNFKVHMLAFAASLTTFVTCVALLSPAHADDILTRRVQELEDKTQ